MSLTIKELEELCKKIGLNNDIFEFEADYGEDSIGSHNNAKTSKDSEKKPKTATSETVNSDKKTKVETKKAKEAEQNLLEKGVNVIGSTLAFVDLGALHMGLFLKNKSGKQSTKHFKKAFNYYRMAANQGHRMAQLNLAIIIHDYLIGKKEKVNFTIDHAEQEYIKYLKMAAAGNEGLPRAKYLLAPCQMEGLFGLEVDQVAAFKNFEIASKTIPESLYFLGQCYQMGLGTTQCIKVAVNKYFLAEKQGCHQAMNELGYCYKRGEGVDQDHKTAFEYFERAAQKGSLPAKINLATYYLEGEIGIERDIKKGLALLKAASEGGSCDADLILGSLYIGETIPEIPLNYTEGFKYFVKAAERGHADAMANVGKFYLYGKGIKKNIPLAIEYLTKAKENGSELAVLELAHFYLYGESQNNKLGYSLFKSLADKGHAVAQRQVGICFSVGRGVKKNPDSEFKYFKLAADQGDIEARGGLGKCYLEGRGVKQDIKLGLEMLHKVVSETAQSPENESCIALTTLGMYYLNPKNIEKIDTEYNAKKAFELFMRAEKHQATLVYKFLARCLLYGLGTEKNTKKAIEFLEIAVKKHDYQAMGMLACLYLKGEGVTQDLVKAVDYLQKATTNTVDAAMNTLAICYLKGIGVPQNTKKAFNLFLTASEKNDEALNNLGWCYLHGLGVEINPKKAVECFGKVKKENCFNATQNLAWCYLNGLGVGRSEEMARVLFRQAAAYLNRAKVNNCIGLSYYSYYSCDPIPDILDKYNENVHLLRLGNQISKGLGFEQNLMEALKLWDKAGAQCALAAQTMAHALYNGNTQSKVEAFKIYHYQYDVYLEKVAKEEEAQEEVLAQKKVNNQIELEPQAHASAYLARCYLEGSGVEQNIELGHQILQEAINAKVPFAYTLLGKCYENGIGVEQSQKLAIEQYEIAAHLGCNKGQQYLGWFYEQELHFKPNMTQTERMKVAYELYLKAAIQENPSALNNVGSFYEEGIYVEKDHRLAYAYYLHSAKLNNNVAQFNMGRCCEHGIGTEINLDQAQLWYNLSGEKRDVLNKDQDQKNNNKKDNKQEQENITNKENKRTEESKTTKEENQQKSLEESKKKVEVESVSEIQKQISELDDQLISLKAELNALNGNSTTSTTNSVDNSITNTTPAYQNAKIKNKRKKGINCTVNMNASGSKISNSHCA